MKNQISDRRYELIWPFKTLIYIFVLLLPFENIIGEIRIGFIGGMKFLGILIGALLFFQILEKPNCFSILKENFLSPISLSAFLFITWSTLSILWAPNPELALIRIFTYIGLFIVMHALGLMNREQIKNIWILLILGSMISVPLGLIIPHTNTLLLSYGRYSSGGQDPNDYANLIIVVFSVVFFGILSSEKEIRGKIWKFALFIAAIIALLSVPLTLSRTALVNIILITIISYIMGIKKKLLIKMILIMVFISICIVYLFPEFTEKIAQRQFTIGRLKQEETWSGRIDIWRAATIVFVDHPVKGIGAGNFAFVSPYYSYIAFKIDMKRENPGGGVAHNMLLSVLVETGVIGFLFFASLLLSAYSSARSLINQGDKLGYGLLIGLFAYTLAGMTLTWEYAKIPYLLYGSLLALKKGSKQHE